MFLETFSFTRLTQLNVIERLYLNNYECKSLLLVTAYLDPEDEKLLEEEVSAPSDSKRSQRHNRSVSWLRKTEYISTEYNRFQQSAEKVEAR